MEADFFVSKDESIKNALGKISENKHRVVFVTDNNKVIGCFSDGDFRRLLDKNRSLPDMNGTIGEICNKNYKYIEEQDQLKNHKSLFRNGISVIPVLDKHHVCIKLKFKKNITGFGALQIGKKFLSYIIAEIGNNHNGDFDRARILVREAVNAGADCVKFQMRNLHELYAMEKEEHFDLGSEYIISLLKRYSLSDENLFRLFDYVRELGAEPLCTPWDKVSADKLNDYGLKFFKISSADFTNIDLITHLTSFNKPLILSTGMTVDSEIEEVSKLLRTLDAEFALLHCNSAYPAPYSDINLRYMKQLEKYADAIGYSGHELGVNVAFSAVTLDANIIEKHLTLDKSLEGNDHKVSLLPNEFRLMVDGIRQIEAAMGAGTTRIKSQGEAINKENLGKSVIATKNYSAGDHVDLLDCNVKSPGVGLSPLQFKNSSRNPLLKPISEGEFFFESHFTSDYVFKKEYNLPGYWGIPVRYHDFDALSSILNPKIVEFHLSYKDLSLAPNAFSKSSTDVDIIVHAPELFDKDHLLDLCSPDEPYRQLSIAHMREVIDISLKLRSSFSKTGPIKIITNVGGHSSEDFLDKVESSTRLELLKASLSQLSTQNVEILIQTMPPYPWHFGGQRFHNLFVDPHQIRDFCVDNAQRICFDISHTKLACNYYEQNFMDTIRILHPITAHYHIADAQGLNGEGLQIASGEIDWYETWNLILELGIDETSWIPEVWQGHKDNGAGFAKALSLLEKYTR